MKILHLLVPEEGSEKWVKAEAEALAKSQKFMNQPFYVLQKGDELTVVNRSVYLALMYDALGHPSDEYEVVSVYFGGKKR